jgi:hypothetical protein
MVLVPFLCSFAGAFLGLLCVAWIIPEHHAPKERRRGTSRGLIGRGFARAMKDLKTQRPQKPRFGIVLGTALRYQTWAWPFTIRLKDLTDQNREFDQAQTCPLLWERGFLHYIALADHQFVHLHLHCTCSYDHGISSLDVAT